MTLPTETGRVRFDEVLAELTNELEIVPTSVFGMPSVRRRDGKAFAALYGDDMVFKLRGKARRNALRLDGAHLFEPMARRPMRSWVQVPRASGALWVELASKAEAGLGT
jgi:hypothetical protein